MIKLTKNFSWSAFQAAVKMRAEWVVSDGYVYHFKYTSEGVMFISKTREDIAKIPDGTPLLYVDGNYFKLNEGITNDRRN